MINEGENLTDAAQKAGIDRKTARKYLAEENPFHPTSHDWRTRPDPFGQVWPELESMLNIQPRLEAKTLFEYLLRKYPGTFQEGQLRTLQRKIKTWKGLNGAPKEVFFSQVHKPGELCSSDFTNMDDLKVTIQGSLFSHMLYHFVLTFSNWESATLCYSENFESLSDGLQNALWRLGGVPSCHLTDNLAAAVNNHTHQLKFGARYQTLLDHYGLAGARTQPNSPNENGDVEQAHYRLKGAVDQALMMRNSREFSSIDEYTKFLQDLILYRNASRSERFKEESGFLRELPENRLQDASVVFARVGKGSTVSVKKTIYSVPSRLIGEQVEVRLLSSTVEIWFQGKQVEVYPRLKGERKARIDYRHIIDWLIRKPGAFENYRYKDELYPTSTFRAAYDFLTEANPQGCVKEYLGILKAASQDGEERINNILKKLIVQGRVSLQLVQEASTASEKIISITSAEVGPVDLKAYDAILLQEVGQ